MSGVDRAARLQEITEYRARGIRITPEEVDWLLSELQDVDAALQRVRRAHEQWAFNEISDVTFILRVQQALHRAGETGDHTIRRGQEN